MAKAYKCDRCKRYFDGVPDVTVGLRKANTFSYAEAEEYTLCPDCLDKFRRFLEEEPE